MARIPDQDLERLKHEVSLARLIEGQGHKLTSQGRISRVGVRGTTVTTRRAASSLRKRISGTASAVMPAVP
jgi:hypothetical protein